jgi:hypothetical protein
MLKIGTRRDDKRSVVPKDGDCFFCRDRLGETEPLVKAAGIKGECVFDLIGLILLDRV